MLKKISKYLLFTIIAVSILLLILMIFPKGDLQDQLKNKNVPALGYAIIKNGKITESNVIGYLKEGVPAGQDAIFNVASVTKPLFATMALQLIDKGLLELDEPVYPYWTDPDIASDERHKLLTPRILLSHQSGFPNWRWHNEDGKLSFWNDPGSQYQYSGEGIEYLRKALENKTGVPFLQLMDSIIFEKIGMDDSRLIWDSTLHEHRLANFHNKTGVPYKMHKRSEPVASDDLCTTTEDLAKFALYVMNHQAELSDAVYHEMTTINSDVNGRSGYGLGWQIVPNLPNDEFALVHGGSDEGVRARLVILPKSKMAFLAFVNGDNGQAIIDRLMVDRLDYGKNIISSIYEPIIWRIIYLPFNII